MFLRFCSLFNKVKLYFSYLPRGMQEELVDDMEDYLQLCKIAKLQKMLGESKK